MKRIFHKITSLVILSATIVSCGDEHVFLQNTVPNEGAQVKFLHAAPDAGAVNFFVNDQKVSSGSAAFSGITYASSFPSINYSQFDAGSSGVTVKTVTSATVPVETILATGAIEAEAGQSYTVAITGLTPTYELVVLNDDVSNLTFDGKAYIRFANLIANTTDPLKVVATLNVGTPPAPVVTVIADNLSYKGVGEFIQVDPGDYVSIQLRNAMTDAVIASASNTNKVLTGNRAYTFFARGRIAGAGTNAPALDRQTNR